MITELNYTLCLCCARGCIRIALKILDRRSPKQGLIRKKISHEQRQSIKVSSTFQDRPRADSRRDCCSLINTALNESVLLKAYGFTLRLMSF